MRCYTDYGHNPAEIKNALKIAALQPHRTLWSVWQPHTYSRTKTLFDQFLETFDVADRVLITDIMGAREVDPGDIKSEMLIGPLRQRGVDAVLTPTFDDAEAYLRAHWHSGDVMISHGCGDIDLLNEQIALHGDTPSAEPPIGGKPDLKKLLCALLICALCGWALAGAAKRRRPEALKPDAGRRAPTRLSRSSPRRAATARRTRARRWPTCPPLAPPSPSMA